MDICFIIMYAILALIMFKFAIQCLLRAVYVSWSFVRCKNTKRCWLTETKGNICTYTDSVNVYRIASGRTGGARCVDLKVHGKLILCPNDDKTLLISVFYFIFFSFVCALDIDAILKIAVKLMHPSM